MNHLKLYEDFISKLFSISEKRDLKTREKVTVSSRIVNFLKKYNYTYEGSQNDSEIFVSFKTGDFETIVPSRSLGGAQYSSPQGFYCFDMNGFKPRLFGDDPISPENFNANNLSQSSNTILDLGLGYGNNGNKVDNENIWNEFNGIPRYLYFVKVKDGSLILSHNSNALKFYEPLSKLLRLYSHNFLKDNESKVFDPKDKRDNGLDKKSTLEIKTYFKENKEKYNSNFIEKLLNLFNKIGKDEKNLHVAMYNFLMSCCMIINEDNYYVRFTLLCKSIGIDGFTQRKGEDDYIHPSPKFQTLLLTESCKEDLMKIDLRKELRIDQYVKGEKSKMNLDSFLESMKEGDVLFNKKTLGFTRFINSEDFKKTINPMGDKKVVINTEDFIKVDLDKNAIWNFIKNMKSGDWIRVTRATSESSNSSKIIESMIIQFNDVVNTDGVINFETRGKKFQERVISNQSLSFNINGERLVNQKYPYNLEKKDSETLLFNPESINPPEYKYWVDNKKDLESKGVKFDEFIDEWEKDKIVNNLEELFTNREYKTEYNRVRIYTDMDLLTMLSNFKNNYSDRVFSSNYTKNFVKGSMKLYYYAGGEINKPFKVIDSANPNFDF